jgi:HSP20 family molecular chaperone IbpA
LEQIKAAYENGVLRLMLPKAASTKPRKIAVQVAESGPAQLQEGQ